MENEVNYKFIQFFQIKCPVSCISDNVIEFKDNPNSEIKIIKIITHSFKRLPKPYETQCYEYPTNETQFHCLNKCYEKSYQNHFQCIPKYNSLLTIRLYDDYIDPNVTFCSDYYINKENEFNNNLHHICLLKCPVACVNDLFLHQTTTEDIRTLHYMTEYTFGLNNHFYIEITYLPQLLFIQLVISIANILSLWHGISFIGLLQDMMGYIGRYADNTYIIQILYYIRCSNVNSLPLKILLKVSNYSNIQFVTNFQLS